MELIVFLLLAEWLVCFIDPKGETTSTMVALLRFDVHFNLTIKTNFEI